MNFYQISNRVLVILTLSTSICVAAQQETIPGQAAILSDQASSSEIESTQNLILLAQSDGDSAGGESGDNAASANGDGEQSEPTNYDEIEDDELVDQYSLPRSAAPVAVDASIQSGSPIGRNTQTALSRPTGVKLDSATGFFPSLSIGISTQRNPGRDSGAVADNSEDTVIRIVPTLAYRGALNNRHAYEISIAGSTDNFDELSNLDSDTVVLNGAINLDISDKVQADLFATHAESNDPRGATATRILDANSQNDEYERESYGGRLTIGRRSNTLQLVLNADQQDIDFTNNGQDNRDREDSGYGAGLYWNVGPRTSVFLNGQMREIDYLQPSQNGFDSDETSVTVGVGWEPTFNTSIIFEIGELEKDVTDPAFTDYNDTTYTGRVNWAPTDNTSVGLFATKRTEETTDFLSPFVETELFGVNLNHSFTDRFRGQVFYNVIEDDLVNVRQDDITDFGIGAFYDLTRWLTVGANWQQTDRESTDPIANYEYESFSITADIRLRREARFGKLQTSEDVSQGSE